MAGTLTIGQVVKVGFGADGEYVGQVVGFQPGHIGLVELVWLEDVPNYFPKHTRDLIEQDRVSGF